MQSCFFAVAAGCAGEDPERASVCTPNERGEPCASARLGVEYSATLYTHCGIGWTYFGGRYWAIDPPQPEGANLLYGYLTLVSRDELAFWGDDGRRYAFKKAPTSSSPPPCF